MYPWYDAGELIDLSFLSDNVSKIKEHNDNYEALIVFTVDNLFKNFNFVFLVDGSVSLDGKVGAAVFCPQNSLTLQFKLPKGTTIYSAEAFAISRALNYAIGNNLDNFCILPDNANVITDVKFANFDTSPHSTSL